MAVYKLKILPQQAGYAVQLGDNLDRQATEFGTRARVSVRNKPHIVEVSWLVDADDYNYLMAFYAVWQRQDESYFLMDLVIDNATLQEYRCKFTGSLNVTQVMGRAYGLSAQLEVRASHRVPAADDIILLGTDIAVFNELEQLVNVALPNAVGV